MRKTLLRIAAVVLALVLGCLALSAGTAGAGPLGKQHVRLAAAPVKNRVHRGEQVRIHGHLASAPEAAQSLMAAVDAADVLYLQEETRAGVWVNLASTGCRPDTDFDIGLRLSVSATLTLRVYAPETSLYAAATSSVFALVVL